MNKVILMGRLTAQPELKKTAAGLSVLNFSLAVERRFKDKEGVREVDFIACVAWGAKAEFIAKYFGRGQKALISGSLQVRKWQDKDGNARSSTEAVVDEVYFADGKKDAQLEPKEAAGDFTLAEEDEQLPF